MRWFFSLVLFLTYNFAYAQINEFDRTQADALARTVVRIISTNTNGVASVGSGVVVAPSGIIFTNAHVVEDSTEIAIAMFNGFENTTAIRYSAHILTISDDSLFDFAVLAIDGNSNGTSLNVSTLDLDYISVQQIQVDILDNVFFFAYPQIAAGSLSITSGTITTLQTRPLGNNIQQVFYQSDAVFADGSSGGLVVNENGQFIGIPFDTLSDDAAQLTSVLPITAICSAQPDVCNELPQPSPEPSSNNSIGGTVDTVRLNVRTGAGPEYSEVAQLVQGDRITAIGRNAAGTWIQIQGSGTRWISARFVRFDNFADISTLPITLEESGDWSLKGTPTGVKATPTEVLRIRGGPGSQYKQLEFPDTLTESDTVDIIGVSSDGEWYKVNIGDRSGWIHSEFVRLSGNTNAHIPIMNS